MTRFGCTTCWKLFDDEHIKYWKNKPVCPRFIISMKDCQNQSDLWIK